MTDFTEKEVRILALEWDVDGSNELSDVLHAFADRLAADEEAVPMGWYYKTAHGSVVTKSPTRDGSLPLYAHPPFVRVDGALPCMRAAPEAALKEPQT